MCHHPEEPKGTTGQAAGVPCSPARHLLQATPRSFLRHSASKSNTEGFHTVRQRRCNDSRSTHCYRHSRLLSASPPASPATPSLTGDPKTNITDPLAINTLFSRICSSSGREYF
ncbi:hypothetical protein E2C01_025425 [Portunus trituberculatus]|uniref:Uncharacterized protein n=1 Tax=Portunus trituberculatus TaxID=210409 RepID=A0A5B7EFR4_PORTR|nr:hypothetical protein [Portunus trituberculatus]